MTIFSVYIDDGCIVCDACEEAAPDVFEVTDDTCFIKPTVRIDGGFDRNTDQSGLKPEIISAMSDDILDAAEACPVDVIMVVEDPPSEAAEAEEAPVPETPEAVPEEAAVEDIDEEAASQKLQTVLQAA